MVGRIEFPAKIKEAAIARANGHCQACGLPFGNKRPEVDHILPCALGGQPTLANARAICQPCHKAKTAADIGKVRKADRQRRNHIGAKAEPEQKIASRNDLRTGKEPRIKKASLRMPTEIERRFGAEDR